MDGSFRAVLDIGAKSKKLKGTEMFWSTNDTPKHYVDRKTEPTPTLS